MSAAPESVSPPPSTASRSPLEQPTEYDVDIRSLSMSSEFTINQLPDITPVFKLKRKNMSMHNVRFLYDLNDVALYKMENVSLTDLRYRTRIVDEQSGSTVFLLRRKGHLPGRGGNTIIAWQGDSEEGEPYLRVETGLLRRHFTVKEHATDKVVADARREKIGRGFVLRVEAGYDAALFVFFAIAADANYQDSHVASSSAASGSGAY